MYVYIPLNISKFNTCYITTIRKFHQHVHINKSPPNLYAATGAKFKNPARIKIIVTADEKPNRFCRASRENITMAMTTIIAPLITREFATEKQWRDFLVLLLVSDGGGIISHAIGVSEQKKNDAPSAGL